MTNNIEKSNKLLNKKKNITNYLNNLKTKSQMLTNK